MKKSMSQLLGMLSFILIMGWCHEALAQSSKSKWSTEVLKVDQVLRDWRASHQFTKPNDILLADNLELVTESQIFLKRPDINLALKSQLESFQGASLKKIVSEDRTLMPYILRDYAQTIRDLNRDMSELDSETRKWISKRLDLKLDALEAAIKSIGLPAIPHLSDFQALVVKSQAKLLSARISTMIKDLVQVGQKDLEKAEGENRNRERAKKEIFPNSSSMTDAEPRDPPRLGMGGQNSEPGPSRDITFEAPRERDENR